MYKIDWDVENNLLILKNENVLTVSEYRPVFSAELKLLGFDRFFSFEESDVAPVLWAIRYTYYYKGRKIAELIDNGCLKPPSVKLLDESLIGTHLPLIDTKLWFEKNEALMSQLVSDALLRLYKGYQKYRESVDFSYVAYSGGKDSMVLLDLVKRIIPHHSFFVGWIDTEMENSYTLKALEAERKRCEEEGIDFVTTRSILDAVTTWREIGPPSYENRWCCTVLKSAPNLILHRKYMKKNETAYLAYLGNRANESSTRRKRSYFEEGVKHKGQIDVNGIINWNSLEVFLYLMKHNIPLNESYLLGCIRVGCLVCPNANTISLGHSYMINQKDMEPFVDVVRDAYRDQELQGDRLEEFINLGKWKHREGGAGTGYRVGYRESMNDSKLQLELWDVRTDWKVWIKTIGILRDEADGTYSFQRGGTSYRFSVTEKEGRLRVQPAFGEPEILKLFKGVFKKAAACLGCLSCEANCPHGKLTFQERKPVIADDCLHCSACMKERHQCVVFDSAVDSGQII